MTNELHCARQLSIYVLGRTLRRKRTHQQAEVGVDEKEGKGLLCLLATRMSQKAEVDPRIGFGLASR
jgi:hypothetical protein